MGREISEQNAQVLEMARAGMSVTQIAAAQERSREAVASVVWRARKRGDLPDLPRDVTRVLYTKAKKAGIRLGSLAPVLKAETDIATAEAIIHTAAEGGYATIAEYLVDLAIDTHYENTKKET